MKVSPKIIFAFLFFSPLLLLAQTTVFLSPEEALKIIFKDSKEVHKEDHKLDEAAQKKAQDLLGYVPPKDRYTFYLGKTDGKVDGYALIDEQVGKVLPITFIIRLSPEGKVQTVEVMVYRESHGGEVKSKRFLRQFENKDLNEELRLQGNIVNISGATLSSRALVIGVRRAIVLWNIFYGNSATVSPKQSH
jgi:Na+-translocating ferredoxin:NAD+ oxidoreductase RnfG subunit